ncbi:hypothetical protein BC943DRAFT_378797 [Umbelopsis sp. AD052]|nr:hypothetical protein BC943DRAFT_378797 [Umbelopsis sp. AD052]
MPVCCNAAPRLPRLTQFCHCMSIRTGAILLTSMCLCRGFVGAYNNIIALTGNGAGTFLATAFFLHMSLGFATIVISAIGLLGLYTNHKRIVNCFVPLAFLIIVLVLVDDVASLLEIGMRKKIFINACISNASHRHRAHQNSAAQHQTCEDHWSALLWIRLIILLVNICGNAFYAILVNSVRLDMEQYPVEEAMSLPAYRAEPERQACLQPGVLAATMPEYIMTPPPAYAPAKPVPVNISSMQ